MAFVLGIRNSRWSVLSLSGRFGYRYTSWHFAGCPAFVRLLGILHEEFFAGLLMVSNVKYHSFKGFDFKGRVPFAAIIFMMIIFAIVTIDPPKVFLGLLSIYALSGPLMNLKKG